MKFQPENFTENATITFVPTAAGASGKAKIAEFLKANRLSLPTFFPASFESEASAETPEHETAVLKAQFASNDYAVEEMLIKFYFNQPIDWLVPGITPNGQLVQLPVISTWYFDGEARITSWRVYWDQATVLRQVGLIPSDPTKLPLNKRTPAHASIVPVLTGNQAALRYLNESNVSTANPLVSQLGYFSETTSAKSKQTIDHFSASGSPTVLAQQVCPDSTLKTETNGNGLGDRPSTRFNSKYVGGKSSVIIGAGQVVDDAPKRGFHADPRRYETHFTIGATEESSSTVKFVEDEDMKFGHHRKHGVNGNESHFKLEHDGTPHLEQLHYGKRHSLQHNADSKDSLWSQVDAAEEPKIAKAGPQKNQQSFSIWESSSNGAGTMQSRPSSRVLRAPGGGSSIQLC